MKDLHTLIRDNEIAFWKAKFANAVSTLECLWQTDRHASTKVLAAHSAVTEVMRNLDVCGVDAGSLPPDAIERLRQINLFLRPELQ